MKYGHGSDRFREVTDDRVLARPTEQTDATQEMIQTLLKHVRAQFYTAWPEKRWLQEQKRILMVLTWPASWLTQRGIGLPLDRYDGVLREIIVGIQQHGATAEVKFFPAYFDHAVKAWFIHNGEALYEERKSLRNALDLRFLKGLNPTPARQPDPTEALAAAHRVLATTARRAKAATTDETQPELFKV